MRSALFAGVAATALIGATPARAAQPAGEAAPASTQSSRTTVYQANFFAPFAPRTAYDVVQHVPGFQLDLGSTQSVNGSVDVRGFAGTAGNVVMTRAATSPDSTCF